MFLSYFNGRRKRRNALNKYEVRNNGKGWFSKTGTVETGC
jgi:hypothetical protein